MPKVGLFNKEGQQVGDIQLNEQVFGVEVNKYALHQVVVAQLANKRQGTQSAKTRSEVRGGGIKPWRQKGTGRARQGSIRAPQWIKGGVVFAPKPRDYRMSIPKSMRLIITAEVNENVYKSARNIEGVTVMPVNNINVYDLLNCKTLMITKEAVNKIEEVYA